MFRATVLRQRISLSSDHIGPSGPFLMAAASPLLSERILPTRRAARRASAVFADQLQNSPGRSDNEPEPSDSFGEPASRRQPNVKYRYNAKGKFRASPLKQTDSPSPSPKRQPKHKRKPKPIAPSHTQSSIQSKKRKASTFLSDREGTASTLTALSPSPFPSLPTSPISLSKNLPPLSTTPLQKLGTRSGSMRSIGASGSKATSFSQPLSQSSSRKKKADAKSSGQANRHPFGDVDTLVWVLVNDLGVVVTTLTHDDDDIEFLEERMWWPARVSISYPTRNFSIQSKWFRLYKRNRFAYPSLVTCRYLESPRQFRLPPRARSSLFIIYLAKSFSPAQPSRSHLSGHLTLQNLPLARKPKPTYVRDGRRQ